MASHRAERFEVSVENDDLLDFVFGHFTESVDEDDADPVESYDNVIGLVRYEAGGRWTFFIEREFGGRR